MNNIRFELLLTSSEPIVSTPAQSIFRAFGGDPNTPMKPNEPGVTIRNENKKYALNWKYNSCGLVFEDVMDHNECIGKIIDILKKINEIAPMKRLSERTLRTFWSIPVKQDFRNLEKIYRSKFMKDVSMFNDYTDSSIVIENAIDSWVLHHQSGAMTVEQLQAVFRVFKLKEGFPKVFLFLEAKIVSNEDVEYSTQGMQEYVKKAFTLCKNHSDKFETFMEEVL
jgi:hypothetical protein